MARSPGLYHTIIRMLSANKIKVLKLVSTGFEEQWNSNANQVFNWRRLYQQGLLGAPPFAGAPAA
ncbi:hypothetical protein [Rugamonas fusca]|nr:hypothetical protein [Rugamonas fusca]